MEPKKTEKLVSAIYLLTSFFDEKEPIKWRLRELGGKLISMRDNRNVVLEIMSLFTVAKNAGLLSDMNYEIVHKEFSKLAPQNPTISDLFFQTLDESKVSIPEEKVIEKAPLYIASSVRTSPAIKDKIARVYLDHTEGVVAVKKNSRQNVILNLLKKKSEIMIKDVTPLIAGVSEKTIQRELLAMVSSGILRKEGEKRWSRYTLAE